MFKVLPYRQGSKGAKDLAEGLGGRVLLLRGSRYRYNPRDTVINWGNTDDRNPLLQHALNGAGIRDVSNKREFFRLVHRLDPGLVPEFWEDSREIPDDAFRNGVVCRTVLAGHSGEGIVIANGRDELVQAPLYTQYKKKQDEYRIHVGRTQGQTSIISIQKKARRNDHQDPNWQVRNLANGFVYTRNDVNPPESVVDSAVRALLCTRLDFGAVDVIYNQREDRSYVLEINSAPGVTGTTTEDYVRYFRGL